MTPTFTGFHHLTAVTAQVRENYRFYTQVLGMRLVKRTVNQDDVSAYHLFYADGGASPGTDMTFFDWHVPREQRGTHSITRTGLRVAAAALPYWELRLREHGVTAGAITERDGRTLIDFDDPEGQRLTLIDDGGAGDPPVVWDASPVPAAQQIRGLGPVTISVPQLRHTDVLLMRVLGMQQVRSYTHDDSTIYVYQMDSVGPHAELHVAEQPGLAPATAGAGGVHHVAFRTPDNASYQAWIAQLAHGGVRNSGPVDRYYFRSLYFREPNGILFEIATDGPGFAVDEDAATLGETVILPPALQPRRAEILAGLKPID